MAKLPKAAKVVEQISKERNSKKLKCCILSIHPAPYRDPVFLKVRERDKVDSKVFYYFDMDYGHTEWEWVRPASNLFGSGFPLWNGDHLHLGLIKKLYHGDYDVIVVPGYRRATSLLALAYAKVTKTSFILNLDTSINHNELAKRKGIRNWFVRFVLRGASTFWVTGRAARKYLQSQRIQDSQIFEGGYCFDSESIRLAVERSRFQGSMLREKLQIPKESFVFLSVGRMMPFRRFPFLVQTFARMDPSLSAYLIVVGDGPEKNELDEICKDSKFQSVRILQPIRFDALPPVYAAADAYVHAGAEPFSTATEYAAIAGLPIIATSNVGYIHDLIDRGISPLLFQPGDGDGLLGKMEELVSDPLKSKELGNRLQKMAVLRSIDWAAGELENAVYTAKR